MAAALAAQIGWGAYPVLLRYLQTVSGIPSLSLLAAGNLVVLALVGAFLWRRIDKKLFRLPIVWLFGFMVVVRGVSNLLATRFTLAVYAQLIYLMTPFLVAILSRVFLRERLPRYTFRALTISLLGVLLVLSGSFNEIGVATAVPRQDVLGIGLAIGSSLALALYMILTRRAARYHVAGDTLLLVHLFSLFSFSAVASLLLGENLNQWSTLSTQDWLIFAVLAFGVLLGANVGQIRTIQRLGAPLVSSLMAIRLVSALVIGALLLHEQLSSLWQAAGAVIVIVTITWFLRRQM
ncbi:MAG: DMT family transporter [Ardenticatenaceae bacterium]|nr:DMT family transporter [Ardenticatenaceae bacterium]